MNGDNKVAGVGPKQGQNMAEPRLSGAIADQLSMTAGERAKAIEDAKPKVETPKPAAHIAAAAEALANENIEKPKEAVFDEKSAAAKTERNKKNRKTAAKILLILVVLALLGGGVYLIIQAINSSKFADTKSRANALYVAVEKLSDENKENACYKVKTNYNNKAMGAETFATWAENCRADITAVSEAVKQADEDAGIKKDDNLATKWASFKTTYNAMADELLATLDFYEAAHTFILLYEKSNFAAEPDTALAKLDEAVAAFKESGDERLTKLGEDLENKLKSEAESQKAVAETERKLVEKYGDIEAAVRDAEYNTYWQQLENYNKAKEEYASVSESLYKGGVNLLEDLTELKTTLYDQAGALSAAANKYN